MEVTRASMVAVTMLAFVFAVFLPSAFAHSAAPAPAPTSDGTAIDQGIAYALMMVEVVVAFEFVNGVGFIVEISFSDDDVLKSEGGLYIDMNTFLAFGKDCVGWNFEKTGNPVYLHIRQTRKLVCEDRPLKKPTLLAIGVDGGFDNNETEYEETKNIVILPDYVTLPFPSVELPEKVRLAVDAILMAEGAERKEQVASWTADKKHISEYTLNLQQLGNGVIIPPSGWKCAKCDKTENLWLNLTDGMILCGRRNWDGSGGNNHAIEHFKETGYPVAVKLGTITADLDAAGIDFWTDDRRTEDKQNLLIVVSKIGAVLL
ncbi:hypothetical protein C3L33_03313, partial [Rhododendron williamsianum]